MFKIGQLVKIVSDNFEQDPHGIEIGTLGIVEEIFPETPFEELPPIIQFAYQMNGFEPVDFPERIHVAILDEDGLITPNIYANVLPSDIVPVAREGDHVRILEDDLAGGFEEGHEFLVEVNILGELVFYDNDGDERLLEAFEYEII